MRQNRKKQRIWSHLLNKSLMETFIFCAVVVFQNSLTAFEEVQIYSIYFY